MKAIIFFLAVALGSTLALAQEGQLSAPAAPAPPTAPSIAPSAPPAPTLAAPPQRRVADGYPFSFLAARDYIIRFREGVNIFDGSSAYPTYPTPICRVIDVSSHSWVYLEFPEKAANFAKWNVKRREIAHLNVKRAELNKKLHEFEINIAKRKSDLALLTGDPTEARTDREKEYLKERSDEIARLTEENETAVRKVLEHLDSKFNAIKDEIARDVVTVQVWVNLDNAISIMEAFAESKLTAKAHVPAAIDIEKHPEAIFVRQF